MIADLKPYPAMKDSGVPWLGAVPEHWAVRRLKYVLKERDVRSLDGNEQLLRVSQFTGVTERKRADGGDEPDTRAESLVGYKRVEPNDLVVNIMLAWNGSMGVSSFEGIASPAYCVYRFGPQAQPWYFHHLLRSPVYKARIKAVSTGVVESRLRLYTDDLYRLDAFLPPLAEQAAIVRFLDHVDRRIRRYIRAKQKLIKLLEEQKQAIIHRAVTRGLDPNVRLKPSGVEWLGDVPEHWEVMRLARIIADGPRNGISPPINEQGVIESFSISAVRDGKVEVRPEDIKLISGDKDALEQIYRLARGDVLLVRGNGNIRLVGKAGVVEDDMPGRVYPDLLMRVRFNSRCLPQYLVAVLNCPIGRDQIETAARTAVGTFKINNQQVRHFCVALPSVAEQRRLLDWLDREIGAVTSAAHHARNEISLLREYRTSLIADVVTGKLDVREAAARLQDEVEEPEITEEIEERLEVEDENSADGLEGDSEEAVDAG